MIDVLLESELCGSAVPRYLQLLCAGLDEFTWGYSGDFAKR